MKNSEDSGGSFVATAEFIQLLTTNQSRVYAYILSLVFDPDHANDV